MPETSMKCNLLKSELEKKSKNLVCIQCFKSYATWNTLKSHCSNTAGDEHKGLAADDFSTFRHSYSNAIGRDINGKELPLYRGDCFQIEFVIGLMLLDLDGQYSMLLKIASKAGLEYICPPCVQFFKTSTQMYNHFLNGDSTHQKLASSDYFEFKDPYFKTMGREFDELPGQAEVGTPSFHKCFKVKWVLDNMRDNKSDEPGVL